MVQDASFEEQDVDPNFIEEEYRPAHWQVDNREAMTISKASIFSPTISDGQQYLYRFDHQVLSSPSKGLWQNLNQTFDWVSEYTLTVHVGMSDIFPYVYSTVMIDFRMTDHTVITSRIIYLDELVPGAFTPMELTLDTREYEEVVGKDIIIGVRFVAESISLAIDQVSVCVNRYFAVCFAS